MAIIYMHCKETWEGDPAGYVITHDAIANLTDLDYEYATSIWFCPNTSED